MVRLPKIVRLFAFVLPASVVLLCAGPAMATGPTTPSGEALHAYGYDPNTQEAILNTVDGSATIINPGVAPSALVYAEGAGYDSVTGKTWLVTDNGTCNIWSLDSAGVVENKYNVRTIASDPYIDKCWALMTNNDGTAWVSAENTGNGAHYLMQVNLANGALMGAILTPSNAITGMSKHPTSDQVWASSAANASSPGLYKLDLSNGALTDQIPSSSLPGTPGIWDIAFDSSGRLWMSVWGNNAQLASIVPTSAAASPATYQLSGDMMLGSSHWDSDALWFMPSAPVTPSDPSGSVLATTGSNANTVNIAAFAAMLFIVGGAGVLVVKRAQR